MDEPAKLITKKRVSEGIFASRKANYVIKFDVFSKFSCFLDTKVPLETGFVHG